MARLQFQQKFRSNNQTFFTPFRLIVIVAFVFVIFVLGGLISIYNDTVKKRLKTSEAQQQKQENVYLNEMEKTPALVPAAAHTINKYPDAATTNNDEDKQKYGISTIRNNNIDSNSNNTHTDANNKESGSVANVTIFFERNCKGGESYTVSTAENKNNPFSTCQDYKGKSMQSQMRSVRVSGNVDLDIFERCDDIAESYWASVMEIDGCTNVYDWPPWGTLRLVPGTLSRPPSVASGMVKRQDESKPAKYVVAYSVESSKYFGYQVFASLHGFQVSGQTDASYMRLLTCQKEDDLAQRVPTWTAKRHPYSRRYGPLNKPDVTTKWLASPYAPKEEVIVMIDPDNWLTKDVRPFVDRVKRGRGVAQVAYYGGSDLLVREMYKRFCEDPLGDGHCDGPLAMASVPYIISTEDFKVIAPLWKMYALAIKEGIEVDRKIVDRFGGIQIEWCAEMFAFNMACAHANVVIELENDLQIRDVGTTSQQRASHIPMIHMGRAWFPKGHELAKPFLHTEGRSFAYLGDQVWCKCNDTAADVLPWPIPDNLDYVSDITLRYLHDSKEKFGYVGTSEYRPKGYHTALP